jgi:hypothetical protein
MAFGNAPAQHPAGKIGDVAKPGLAEDHRDRVGRDIWVGSGRPHLRLAGTATSIFFGSASRKFFM